MIRVLIADDDKNIRKFLVAELADAGFDVAETDSGARAITMLEESECDVLLLDVNMPGLSGIEVLENIGKLGLPVEVIVLTGHGTISLAVEAMKLGAYDFLPKPFKTEELKAIIGKAHEKKQLRSENLLLKRQIGAQCVFPEIVTGNAAMLELLETVKTIGASELPVHIAGESGVGKELVARAVHRASENPEGPFIPINCGAIPENMLESELFGYEKGAFTGAANRKLGLIEVASGGTLFLDEVGDLTLPLQGKLLRVLETGRFMRLGALKEIEVKVRIVSATNKDLEREVEEGNLRRDFYYRICGLTLKVPPLRDRTEDIPPLVKHIIGGNPAFRDKVFTGPALTALAAYPWPGNVRELQNVVHRILLLSKRDEIHEEDLPPDLTSRRRVGGGRSLEDMEREHILQVLDEVDGHRGKAASILGIDPKTLYRKLSAYGMAT